MSKSDNKGQVFVISAPSGTGKTTLVRLLKQQDNSFVESISHTTRAIRQGEADGVDYHFVDVDTFKQMQAADAFVESFEVFGNLYATSKQAVNSIVDSGKHAILILDTKGALYLKEIYGKSLTTVFILPPSIEEIKKRLITRNTDSTETINQRLCEAYNEIAQASDFDYQIINDNLNKAVIDLQTIIKNQV